jgi:hypothetical protein
MLYRALTNLGKKERVIPAGSLIDPSEFAIEALDALLRKGKIAPVASPPLSVLPNWKTRAKKLEASGISTIEQLLECGDIEKLAKEMKTSKVIIQSWIAEARKKLEAPARAGG